MNERLAALVAWMKAHPKASIALLAGAGIVGYFAYKSAGSAKSPELESVSGELVEGAAGAGGSGLEEPLPTYFDQPILAGLPGLQESVTPRYTQPESAYVPPISIPTSTWQRTERDTILEARYSAPSADVAHRAAALTARYSAPTGEQAAARSMPSVASYRTPTTHEQVIRVPTGRTSPLAGGT